MNGHPQNDIDLALSEESDARDRCRFAGCRVTDGTVERGANVRLIRDNVVIHEGKLGQLKRFKDDAKEVVAGQECGMSFENYQDMRAGDIIECYRVETIQRSL